jgi:subtilisin-like proprotein convertase family protein
MANAIRPWGIRLPLSVLSVCALAACEVEQVPVGQVVKGESSAVIYGADNRKNLVDVADTELRRVARSTVALMESDDLSDAGSGRTRIRSESYATRNNLCSDEPFREEKLAAFCSGSLVAPNLVITAGHCITAAKCASVKFVFDYAVTTRGVTPEDIESSKVYGCAEVVGRELQSNGSDWAVVRLDRAVADREPLRLRRSGEIAAGAELVVIGHPVGLPTKIAGGAKVRSLTPDYFVANLDTYGGNSGSAVFNAQTLEIEGILVRGETDFVARGSCMVSNRCADDACRGEDVTRISKVLAHVPGATPSPTPDEPSGEYVSRERQALPDMSSAGILSQITGVPAIAGRALRVSVEIRHTYRGDLKLTLVAPSGRTQVLKAGPTSDATDDLITAFAVSGLSEEGAGNWGLKVEDLARADLGELVTWKIALGEGSTPVDAEEFASAALSLSIPDNSALGIRSAIEVSGAPRGRRVQVEVDLTHSYRGDLKITITAPDGKSVVLKAGPTSDSADHVRGTFGAELASSEDLQALSAVEQSGSWSLQIQDLARADLGVLRAWKLRFLP